ncbi:MAG: hypothetical protein EKK57_11420 [Proteobacteria bacterium]|nr:MAG: hypothetical protein EKK57_11420 [Pseudomonadota bacterium]
MKIITSQEDFQTLRSRQLIELECCFCSKIFTRPKNQVMANIKAIKNRDNGRFCSHKCWDKSNSIKIEINCLYCQIKIIRPPSHIKNGKAFCSQSHAARYNNAHKTKGCRRSKFEIWIESQFKNIYPDLDIKYNFRLDNSCELDIYIPKLKLAFEINGVFHYQPIYGEEKLNKIKERDSRKIAYCQANSINLHTINISNEKSTKLEGFLKYFELIKTITNNQLLRIKDSNL